MTRALSSLTNRIFLASTLLATVSIGVAMYLISARLRAEAEVELRNDLTLAARVVDEQRATLVETFTRTATLIADLPKFKAVLETRDPPTIAPIARDYQRQTGSDLFVVTDPEGVVLASLGDSRTDPAATVDDASTGPIRVDAGGATFWPHDQGVLQVVSVPVVLGLERPETLGALTIGYLFDAARAETFKTVTGADIAFAMGGRVRASTLAPGAHPTIETVLGETLVPHVVIGDEEYSALIRPLDTPGGMASATAPVAIVLHSRSARMRTLSAIQTGLIIVGALTVLMAVALSYGVARTITRPLAIITDHMRQVALTGDLTRKLPVARSHGWQDEDARVLAATFNTLTDSVARFQREAAQRERLSSLGRMSTIVAHEIRNPLMIIKGALRQLRRDGASAADVRDAAADIDGETERLNRVVNEVLDFARPIRFDCAPTDIDQLCLEAIAAVTAAAGAEPAVRADLDAAGVEAYTDRERLRTVLVNLLTNARHAVLARGDEADAGGAPIVLSTQRLTARRAVIVIRDRGIGIPPEDLPRIFDPYFTTRRAGTGLGLPIAKNIIDGLGGTLTVTSTPGSGTSTRVEVGDAPGPRT